MTTVVATTIPAFVEVTETSGAFTLVEASSATATVEIVTAGPQGPGWTANQNIELTSGFSFRIDGATVLGKTGLGSSVVSSSLTSVGTLTSGTWNASTIAVAYGGTGATTLTGYVKGSGTNALTASATIPNTDITGLGTMSTQNANNVAITGGTIDGITIDGGTY